MKTIYLAALVALLIGVSAQAKRPSRPNVILIMADDIGAEGLGCYGSTIYTTPHLDRMAREGARFENAYATPLCTPTRVQSTLHFLLSSIILMAICQTEAAPTAK